jgi:hypothetical protein
MIGVRFIDGSYKEFDVNYQDLFNIAREDGSSFDINKIVLQTNDNHMIFFNKILWIKNIES